MSIKTLAKAKKKTRDLHHGKSEAYPRPMAQVQIFVITPTHMREVLL